MTTGTDDAGKADPGTYVLIVDLAEPTSIEFGAVGAMELDAGRYAYVGSAFGPGGLSRVDRHRELAEGHRDTRHWHIDYLLGHDAASIVRVLAVAGVDRECAVATALGTSGHVLPLGASDCDCRGHLVQETGDGSLEGVASSALRE